MVMLFPMSLTWGLGYLDLILFGQLRLWSMQLFVALENFSVMGMFQFFLLVMILVTNFLKDI